jgi:hypothetical protein
LPVAVDFFLNTRDPDGVGSWSLRRRERLYFKIGHCRAENVQSVLNTLANALHLPVITGVASFCWYHLSFN